MSIVNSIRVVKRQQATNYHFLSLFRVFLKAKRGFLTII